jgi:uncharacterized protein with HEPN domain
MSESTPAREGRFYVGDMLGFCDKALAYTTGLDRAGFSADEMRYDGHDWSIVRDDLVPLRSALAAVLSALQGDVKEPRS